MRKSPSLITSAELAKFCPRIFDIIYRLKVYARTTRTFLTNPKHFFKIGQLQVVKASSSIFGFHSSSFDFTLFHDLGGTGGIRRLANKKTKYSISIKSEIVATQKLKLKLAFFLVPTNLRR